MSIVLSTLTLMYYNIEHFNATVFYGDYYACSHFVIPRKRIVEIFLNISKWTLLEDLEELFSTMRTHISYCNIHTHIFIYTHTHIYIHTHTHIYLYTHSHTHIRFCHLLYVCIN